MNEANFKRQTEFLKLLENLNFKQLSKLYLRLAKGPHRHTIPPWLAKKTLRHRCFLLYANKWPVEISPYISIYIERILRTPFIVDTIHQTLMLMDKPISREQIDNMEGEKIDRILLLQGIQINQSVELATRRKILYELIHGKRPTLATRENITSMITPLLIKDPALNYGEFFSKYEGIAPRVSAVHFRNIKKRLRKKGLKLKKLRLLRKKRLARDTTYS